MRVVRVSSLFVVGTLAVCGCNQDVRKPISPEVMVSTELSDFCLPESAAHFNVFDFGVAEIDEENADQVLFGRCLFEPHQVTKVETFDVPRLVKTTREVTDEAGKKQIQVEEIEVAETRTREYATTVYEVVGNQILSCPLRSLTAFDSDGKKLSAEGVRDALVLGRRAVLRSTDNYEDPFYGGFFDEDTLFVYSNEWVDVDYVPAPTPAPVIEPEVRVLAKPMITDLAIAY